MRHILIRNWRCFQNHVYCNHTCPVADLYTLIKQYLTRLSNTLLLLFCCCCTLAQTAVIRINIYIEAGASAGMSYFDTDSGYSVRFIRTPVLTKDSLIEKVVYTSHPLLFSDGFRRLTQYPLFPGDDITIRCSARKRAAKNNHTSASTSALLFFTALNQAGQDMDLTNNTTGQKVFKKVTAYTDELDSLIQLAYQQQLAFLDGYLQNNPMTPVQQQFIRDILHYSMISNRLMPWYNPRFKGKPLSARYLQSVAGLKKEFTNASLLYTREYQFALLNYNKYLCKSVPNPPSGNAMKDAFYISALQNFSLLNADYLLYDLMRISAVTSKEWFVKNIDRFNKDCQNAVFKTVINDTQKDVALALSTDPDSTNIQDVNSTVFSLKELLVKTGDSVVYVDFWAGWCAPCLAEMRHSVTLQQRFKNKKIAFVYLSMDNSRPEWLKSMKGQPQMNASNSYFLVNGGHSGLSKWVNLNSIPRYIIYDKTKKLVRKDAPRPSEPEVNTVLNQLLEN